MTIESSVSFQVFDAEPGVTPSYAFTIENTGDFFEVWEVVNFFAYTVVDPADYSIVLSGNPPLYSGGTLTFNRAHPAGVMQVRVIRRTPESQLIDYSRYGRFPTSVHEFGLDKLTLLAQETSAAVGELRVADLLLQNQIDAIENESPILRARIDGTTVTSQQGTNLIQSVENDTVGTYNITLTKQVPNIAANAIVSATLIAAQADKLIAAGGSILDDRVISVFVGDLLSIPSNQAFNIVVWDNNA